MEAGTKVRKGSKRSGAVAQEAPAGEDDGLLEFFEACTARHARDRVVPRANACAARSNSRGRSRTRSRPGLWTRCGFDVSSAKLVIVHAAYVYAMFLRCDGT